MKLHLTLLGLFIGISCFGQNDYDSWDQNYSEVNVDSYINFHKLYADSVKMQKKNNYFLELSPLRHRFMVKYLGSKKSISTDTLHFIKKICKLQIGDTTFIDTYYQNEYLFETTNGLKIWVPMQNTLENDFKKEVKKNKNVLLYCACFIELTIEGRFNMVFIANEFIKQ
jgi:hypothetical protein